MARSRRTGPDGSEAEEYSLWTAPPTAWTTPFPAARVSIGIERALDGVQLERRPEDDRIAAFRTSVTWEVLSLPTQDWDGLP